VQATVGFWETVDSLVGSSRVVIDRPKGSTHPRFPDLVYPLDYGYLENTVSSDGAPVDIWRGTGTEPVATAAVVTVDTLKNDSEVKYLLACTDEEIDVVLDFHNGKFMKAIVLRR
jgi:inorganic pyrophosphatase